MDTLFKSYIFLILQIQRMKSCGGKIIANPSHALYTLIISLPLKRKLRDRGHDYELPNIRTERFKGVFLNRFLFKLV